MTFCIMAGDIIYTHSYMDGGKMGVCVCWGEIVEQFSEDKQRRGRMQQKRKASLRPNQQWGEWQSSQT